MNSAAGFTLVEILVSLTLFTIVVTISVGSLMVLINVNSKVQTIQSAIENVSFALDDMTRNIRTGSHYQCPASDFTNPGSVSDCTTGTASFAYTESDYSLTGSSSDLATWQGSNRIAYKLDTNTHQIMQHLGTGNLSDNKWQPLTASNVDITDLEFFVTNTQGYAAGDAKSPTVTIYVKGVADAGHASSTFELETTVNQIVLDL